eukprot:g1284.t1
MLRISKLVSHRGREGRRRHSGAPFRRDGWSGESGESSSEDSDTDGWSESSGQSPRVVRSRKQVRSSPGERGSSGRDPGRGRDGRGGGENIEPVDARRLADGRGSRRSDGVHTPGGMGRPGEASEESSTPGRLSEPAMASSGRVAAGGGKHSRKSKELREGSPKMHVALTYLPAGWVEIEVLRAVGLKKKRSKGRSSKFPGSSRRENFRVRVAALWSKKTGGKEFETLYAPLQRSPNSSSKTADCCIWTTAHNNRLKFFFPGGSKLSASEIVDLVGFDMVILRGRGSRQALDSSGSDEGRSDEVIQKLRVTDQVQEVMRKADALDQRQTSEQQTITMLFWYRDKSGQILAGPPGKLVCSVRYVPENRGSSIAGGAIGSKRESSFRLPLSANGESAEASLLSSQSNEKPALTSSLLHHKATTERTGSSSQWPSRNVGSGSNSFDDGSTMITRDRRAASHQDSTEAPPPKIPPRPGEEERRKKELAKKHTRIINLCDAALDYIGGLKATLRDEDGESDPPAATLGGTKKNAVKNGMKQGRGSGEGKADSSDSSVHGTAYSSWEGEKESDKSALHEYEKRIAEVLDGARVDKLEADVNELEVEIRVLRACAGTMSGDHNFTKALAVVMGGVGMTDGGEAALGLPPIAKEPTVIEAARERLKEELVAASSGIKEQGLASSRAIYDTYFEGNEKSTSGANMGVPWWVTAVFVVLFLAVVEKLVHVFLSGGSVAGHMASSAGSL